jgi:hypothetical protein
MPEASTYRDQLERLKVAVAASARAPERLLDAQAGSAYTVRDVDDARQFLEFPKELLRYERVIARPMYERFYKGLLHCIAADASQGGDYHESMEE